MPHHYTRYFTPTEANDLLPEVVGLIGQIIRRINRAHALASQTATVDGSLMPAVDTDLSALQTEINQRIQWINSAGVAIKMLAPATISFPALRCGQEVHLVWSEGDDAVQWWSQQGEPSDERHAVASDPESWWEWVH